MKYVDLGQLVKIQKGKKLDEVYVKSADTLRYIQIEDLRNDENIKYTSSDLKSATCDKNDVLIAWDGANAGTIGFGLKGAIGSTLAKLTPIKEFFTPFVGRFLQSKFTYLRNSCTGATIPHISKSVLIKIQIPLPPLSEQKRIAEILDKADALRQKNKQLLSAYDELLQSTFLDMFGDPVTNSKGWKKVLLAKVITDIVGGSSFGGEQRELQEDEFGVLKISSVTTGTFISTEYKAISSKRITKPIITPRKGDLLFSRANTREMVGAVAIVDNDYERLFLPDKLWRIDLNKKEASQFYLHKLLTNDRFRPELSKVATGTSGSMLNISKAKLIRLPIPLPPIKLQNQFAQIVENIEAQKTLVKASLQESEDLFNGLVQKAFGG